MKTFGKSPFKIAALAVIGLSTAFGAATSVQAAKGAGHAKKADRLSQKLNLSDAQKAQIQNIFNGARADSQAVKNDTSLTEAQRRDRLKGIHKTTQSAMMNVLTPTQQAQWQQIKAEHRGGHVDLGLNESQKASVRSIRHRAQLDARAVRNNTSLTKEQKRAQLKTIHQQSAAAVNALLTPEQQEKLQAAKAQRRNNTPQQNGGLNG